MKTQKTVKSVKTVVAATLAAWSIAPFWAQAQMTMPAGGHAGHEQQGHAEPPATPQGTMSETMPGMQHGDAGGDAGKSAPMQHDGKAMDHSSMGSASMPADVRDPHAYADGYTLESGKYALPGPRQLMLADEHHFGTLLVDRFERAYGRDANETAYDVQAWFGRDYDRLVLKAEGDVSGGKLQEARTELLWGHAIASFWDAQVGLRADSGTGPDRGWLAFGVQGLAPYWFEVDAAAYLGNNGRAAVRLGAEYELLLTQRLILQPRAEVNFYGKSDTERDIGSGLSDGVAGVRLRYEFTRQIAPYIGVEWTGKFGETADLARAAGERTTDTRVVAGVRFWF